MNINGISNENSSLMIMSSNGSDQSSMLMISQNNDDDQNNNALLIMSQENNSIRGGFNQVAGGPNETGVHGVSEASSAASAGVGQALDVQA